MPLIVRFNLAAIRSLEKLAAAMRCSSPMSSGVQAGVVWSAQRRILLDLPQIPKAISTHTLGVSVALFEGFYVNAIGF